VRRGDVRMKEVSSEEGCCEEGCSVRRDDVVQLVAVRRGCNVNYHHVSYRVNTV
jgi:hypothetical protein